jgi:hypothetical protein
VGVRSSCEAIATNSLFICTARASSARALDRALGPLPLADVADDHRDLADLAGVVADR